MCLKVSNLNLYLLCLQVNNMYLLCCVSTGEQLQPVPAGSQEGAGGAHGLHQVWALWELATPRLCHQRGATPRACSQGCHSNLQSQTVSGCTCQLCDRRGGIRIRSVGGVCNPQQNKHKNEYVINAFQCTLLKMKWVPHEYIPMLKWVPLRCTLLKWVLF